MKTVRPTSFSRYADLEPIWQDEAVAFCRARRLNGGKGRQPVFLVIPIFDHPSAGVLERLAQEHALKDELDESWSLRPLELTREGGRTLLVLADPGGEPLDRLLGGRPLGIEAFLPVAIRIASTLGEVHKRGIIHKLVKPAHIFVDEAKGMVRLTGFGVASRVPREHPQLDPPETIAGDLAYMSPEQTGRMNRSVDSRSDLYALGVTFYQMLTGALPFMAADPMEWVHRHIALQPPPLSEHVAGLPEAISSVIFKLLAKTPEDRYQTAAGVVADLERCFAEWRSEGEITPFPVGLCDQPTVLRIPEKLYGREREVEALRSAFEGVARDGKAELVLVCGYPGIGKSSVVHELLKDIVPRGGLFATGKFDQYQRDIPYATIAQAFRNLVRQILAQSDEALATWRADILEAVRPNGQLVTELIPELELIIDRQPVCPRLGAEETERRFQTVWRRFLGVFARPDRPLVLFLDDLQWLDPATLDLLSHLVSHPEVRHVLFIGAYRDNEVSQGHRLRTTLDELEKDGVSVRRLVIKPLTGEDVFRLVSETLDCGERGAPLTRMLWDKTAGNPFFVIQFLTTLSEEGLLTFDAGRRGWTWDLERIEAKAYTDNVVDLMVEKMRRLPGRTQAALEDFACLGNAADIGELALAASADKEGMHAALSDAVRAGLVCRQAEHYQFLHDRIQEAAYALIPEPHRAEVHARIGRRLLCGLTSDALRERVFQVVNQLNRGAALITADDERHRVAELNLIAGRRAQSATAYAAALSYLNTGAALLPRDGSQREENLAFALEVSLAECEFLTTAFDEAAARLSDLSQRAASLTDLASVTCLRLAVYTALDRADLGVAASLEYLQRADIVWTPHPSEEDVAQEYQLIRRHLGDHLVESLLQLPPMEDRDCRATMNVLTELIPSAIRSDNNLHALLIGRMVNLSLKYGNGEGSPFAYIWAGSILRSRFGQYSLAGPLGRIGFELMERRGLDRFAARIYSGFGDLIVPWSQDLSQSLPLMRRGFEIARERGDLGFAVFNRISAISLLLASGEPLDRCQEEAERALVFVREVRFAIASIALGAELTLIRELRGLPANQLLFEEDEAERRLVENSRLLWAAGHYWVLKLQTLVFAGEHAAAVEAASKAERALWRVAPFFCIAEYHLFAALAHTGAYSAAPLRKRPEHLDLMARHHAQLAEWAEICPQNFKDRAALVGAEIARLDGREWDAAHLYEQAVAAAQTSGFVQNEALASELAGEFYLSQGLETNATAHLRNALRCYARWGAESKIRQLEERHPHLSAAEFRLPAGGAGGPVGQLDVDIVLKASQAISGQIELEGLVQTLMTIILQSGGADRGLLMLPRDGSYRVAAEARATGASVTLVRRDAAMADTLLPLSVLRYVVRTQESVLLDDVSRANPYRDDPYFDSAMPRSMLCLPLVKQTKVAGVLYLENALTARVFTSDRLEVLRVLAAQAVISLENAKLYTDLRARETKIRRLFRSNIIGAFFWDLSGKVAEANDAALQLLGYTAQDLDAGQVNWLDMTPPEYRAVDEEAIVSLRATGATGVYEKEFFRKDGSRVPVLIGGALFEGSQDEGVAFVLDLTERKQAEVRQKTLVDELNHRVKNTLATVQSISAQTLRTAETPAAFSQEFNDRLLALSQTHNVLNQSGWQGASLREILGKILEPHFGGDDGRIEICGDHVGLGPTSAVALGMAFHELATNAVKYGALSTPAGCVRIGWEARAPGRLHIVWQETGGPEVTAPRRQGFGSRLIERTLPRQLCGEVHIDYLPQGVRCEMDAGLGQIGRA